MIFPVAEIISFISHLMTLEPGDVIATGTPQGVGMATGQFLKPGDVIEGKIEKTEVIKKIRKFYAKDRGKTILRELFSIFKEMKLL